MKRILFLFLLVSIASFAQQKAEVNLSNPKSTVYTHIYFLQGDSYQPEKAAATIYGKEKDEAIDIAIKIKRVLDGKGLEIDFNKNVFVGTGGPEGINKSHFLGAAYGMENIMGRADNPVRRVLNYASDNFAKDLPIVYVQTVVSPDENRELKVSLASISW